MKKLLASRGVPFLLTLVMMSVVSGGYLIYELLGIPESAGAAAALQAPDLPPTLNGPPTFGPPPPAPKKQPAAAPVEEPPENSSEELTEESEGTEKAEESSDEPASKQPVAPSASKEEDEDEGASGDDQAAASEPKEDGKAFSEASPKAPGEVKKPAVAGAADRPVVVPPPPVNPPAQPPRVALVAVATAPKAVPAHVVTAKAPAKIASPTKALPVKVTPPVATSIQVPVASSTVQSFAAAVPSKTRVRRAEPEPVSSEVPPEWNWFQKPFQMAVADGRVKIQVKDPDLEVAQAPNVVPVAPVRAVPQPLPDVEPASIPAPVSLAAQSRKAEPELATVEKPFAKALRKMLRSKGRREEEALRAKVVLPSHGGSQVAVPQSLQKLQKAIGEIAALDRASQSRAVEPTNGQVGPVQMRIDHEAISSAGPEASPDGPGSVVEAPSVGSVSASESRFGAGLEEVLRMKGWSSRP